LFELNVSSQSNIELYCILEGHVQNFEFCTDGDWQAPAI